jgi:hypothetical protein
MQNEPTYGPVKLRFADLGFTLLYGSPGRPILSEWNARMCPYYLPQKRMGKQHAAFEQLGQLPWQRAGV